MNTCLLCGLASGDLDTHLDRAHNKTAKEVQAITRDGLDDLARKIEHAAHQANTRVITFEDHNTGKAMRQGGYL